MTEEQLKLMQVLNVHGIAVAKIEKSLENLKLYKVSSKFDYEMEYMYIIGLLDMAVATMIITAEEYSRYYSEYRLIVS